jgi:hypothetical protein
MIQRKSEEVIVTDNAAVAVSKLTLTDPIEKGM